MDGALIRAFQAGNYVEMMRLLRLGGEGQALQDLSFLLPGVALDGIDLTTDSDADLVFEIASRVWDEEEMLAVSMFRQAANAGSTDAILALGEALAWMSMHGEAIVWIRFALEEGFGDSNRLQGLLGESLFATQSPNLHEVRQLLLRGLGNSDEFGLTLAKVLIDLAEFDSAKKLLDSLTARGVYGAALLLGNLLDDELDEPVAAEVAYLRGVESGDAHSAHNLAAMLLRRGDRSRAEQFRKLAQRMGDMTELE